MYKVGVINDTHLGLKTEKIDRTDEIYGIYKQFARHCKKTGVNAIVVCGDIFDKNNPSEELVAVFISIMNMLSQLKVPVYVVVGNHDAIADPEHLSCLSFIKKLKKRYPDFQLIEDIVCTQIEVTDLGPLYFTFLPHISKALLEKKQSKYTTQEYIEKKSAAIYKKVGQGSQHLVFSHLNVRGVHAGSEENLLRKSEVYLPEVLTSTPSHSGLIQPEIIQAHIHCFDDKTEVLTEDGWVYFSNIEKGKEVATYHVESGRIEYQKPTHYITKDFCGDMVSIESSGIDLLVTPEHRLFGRHKRKDEKMFFKANEAPKDYVDFFKAGKVNADGLPLRDDELSLLVQIIADGSYENNYVRFHLKKLRKIKRLEYILKNLEINYDKWKMSDSTYSIRIFNYEISHLLDYIPNKKLTRDFLKLSGEQFYIFIHEYAITDGCYQHGKKHSIQLSTSKREEADILQELCTLNNTNCTLSLKKKLLENQKQAFTLSVNLSKNFQTVLPCRNYSYEFYDGRVYCLTVPNSTLVVRRNNKVVITGNCKQKIGNIHIIGSPLFCGFGEDVTDRYFAVVNQPNRLGEKFSIDYIPTDCKKFYEIELNISGKEKEEFHEIKGIKTFIEQVEPDSIIKINPTIHGDHAGYDWGKVRDKIGKLSKSYVKEIVPKIIRKKVIRDTEQKPNLPPKKAVYVWLKRNKPSGAKRKNELAKEYIEKYL